MLNPVSQLPLLRKTRSLVHSTLSLTSELVDYMLAVRVFAVSRLLNMPTVVRFQKCGSSGLILSIFRLSLSFFRFASSFLSFCCFPYAILADSASFFTIFYQSEMGTVKFIFISIPESSLV
jgi:hypothetical protein